jgi:hypothetical protein
VIGISSFNWFFLKRPRDHPPGRSEVEKSSSFQVGIQLATMPRGDRNDGSLRSSAPRPSSVDPCLHKRCVTGPHSEEPIHHCLRLRMLERRLLGGPPHESCYRFVLRRAQLRLPLLKDLRRFLDELRIEGAQNCTTDIISTVSFRCLHGRHDPCRKKRAPGRSLQKHDLGR